jgi:hypothetical protein
MSALVTSVFIDNVYNKAAYCGIRRWCRTAESVRHSLLPGLEVVIFTNEEVTVRLRGGRKDVQDLRHTIAQECPHARIVFFPDRLLDAAKTWENRTDSLGPCPGYGAPKTLLKWEAVNPQHYRHLGRSPAVLYLDNDVDAGWYAPRSATHRARLRQRIARFSTEQACQLCGSADHSSPLNTGVMLLKPSAELYEDGLSLLRTHRWSRKAGFNSTGSLQSVLNATISRLDSMSSRELMNSYGYRQDSWSFVCGDADQGLFTTMYMARHARYCSVFEAKPSLWVQHFWASTKPWHDPPSCARYFDFLEGPDADGAPSPHDLQQGTPCTRYLRVKATRVKNRTRCRGTRWPLL